MNELIKELLIFISGLGIGAFLMGVLVGGNRN